MKFSEHLIFIKKQHKCPNCNVKISFFYKQNIGGLISSCKNCDISLYIGLPYRIAEISIFVISSSAAIFISTDKVISILLITIGFIASIAIRIYAPLKH